MRLNIDSDKMDQVVKLVNEIIPMGEGKIGDFIDGGYEGWDCGDEEQQEWVDSASANEIASWVIAGSR
jgi:hypothetical protein